MSLALISLCLTASGAAQAGEAPADPHMVFTSPKAGQVFAPGDTVAVDLQLLPPLKDRATDAVLAVDGLGLLPSQFDFQHKSLHWSLTIPELTAGTLSMNPMVFGGVDPAHPDRTLMVLGAPLKIVVRPKETPQSLRMVDDKMFLDWPSAAQQEHQVHVMARYAAGERDITSSASGTRWSSNRPEVATVDPEGKVTVAGPGIAVITAENHGLKVFLTVVVEEQGKPLPAEDITQLVAITRTTPQLDAEAKAYREFPMMKQTVKITNTSGVPIPRPLHLIIKNLAPPVDLWQKIRDAPKNPSPDTVLFWRVAPGPNKAPAVELEPPEGLVLRPDEAITIDLYYLLNNGKLPADCCELKVTRGAPM